MKFLLRLTLGQRQAAEDMLQETLVRAWQNLDKLPEDVSALRPWLFTVARRVAIDAGRAKTARPVEVTMTDRVREPVGPDLAEQVTSVQTIREAIQKLSPDHRSVLIELYYRGSSTADAAQRLGIPEGTVKSRAHYALRSLAATIGRTDGE
jgi:RNA polymerase sigma-70 factor (ECF subfamily)